MQALWRASIWSSKDRDTYERMITKQRDSLSCSGWRENPNLVACQHSLTLSYSHDDFVPLEAASAHIVMVCAGESLADACGTGGRRFDGA